MNDFEKQIEHSMSTGVSPNHMTEEETEILMQVLNQAFFSILRINLSTGNAKIIHSIDFPQYVGAEVDWTNYLQNYRQFISAEELTSFELPQLRARYNTGQKSFLLDVPYTSHSTRKWMQVYGLISEDTAGIPYTTITIRGNTEDHLLKHIIDLYVYNTCDYFIYLDAKNNSYTMFSGTTNGTPLPPAKCEDYSSEVVKYANDYVVPEDREKVIYEMALDHILEQLEHHKVHAFHCGIADPVRGYTRKRLEYRYYDRKSKMILLSRTDITDTFFEEKHTQEKLESALEQARTDSLTGLLNHQGIIDEVSHALKNAISKSALMFIDLDNFKNVNDSHGHVEGDLLLCKVANTLQAEVRSTDYVGRVGGDEFIVFLQDVHSTDSVRSCANRICRKISEISLDSEATISCSIGVAIAPDDGTEYKTLANLSDQRAYYAKSKGKNQVAFHL